MTILESMANEREIQEHLSIVRQRIESEGLSRLELKLRYRQLVEEHQDSGLTDDARELARAESELVREIIHESTPPQPTPAEVVERLKHENPAAAESLDWQLKLEAKRNTVAEAEAALAEAEERGWAIDSEGYRRRAAALSSAQEALGEMEARVPPMLEREAQAISYEQEATELMYSGSMLENSADDGVQRNAQKMLGRADELFERAGQLRTARPFSNESAVS
ncbi:hypothetical protein [Chromatocurvus halotolerans]|uniref:Uncharacterized protein n=1 Tax=Chromatocurvus halotolerans TaxID=1132028 RepID=A0A4R2L3K1_9GAMM|nr:hypothetical protein [Chromatocurvus halotolerans]TCO77148.1 hypothetical protein EV688_103162 [Chromatocurvus halotolerans]